jgi:alkylation response protein AidB-like acyl-CoA dehydrogenase
MDLRDTPEEARLRASLREWLDRMPTPDAARWQDRAAVREWTAALHAAGYAGLTWPREYGGGGAPVSHQAIFLEETARRGASEHIGVIGLSMVGPTIIAYGSPAQKAWFLPRILSGEVVFCQAFSESEAGGDPAAVGASARADGPDLVVTGRKLWSSYAPVADHCLLLVRTDPGGDRHRGLTCLLVDLAGPGVTVRPIRQITGAADFGEIALDEVRVPASAVVGRRGDGWRVAMTMLAHERGTFAFTLAARLEAQFRRLLATARERGADGDPLVRDRITALHGELSALRWTSIRALDTLARTGEPGPETSILKLRWSQAYQRLTALAAQLAGNGAPDAAGDAYWLHHLLRGRAGTIEGGTSQIQRGVVDERVLGLPSAR